MKNYTEELIEVYGDILDREPETVADIQDQLDSAGHRFTYKEVGYLMSFTRSPAFKERYGWTTSLKGHGHTINSYRRVWAKPNTPYTTPIETSADRIAIYREFLRDAAAGRNIIALLKSLIPIQKDRALRAEMEELLFEQEYVARKQEQLLRKLRNAS